MKRIIIISVLLLLGSISLLAQKITLSHEIAYRSDNHFDLLGQIDDKILLFKQKGFKYSMDVFNSELELLLEKELFFEKQKIHINSIIPAEKSFSFIYSYNAGFFEFIKANKYDVKGNLLDSVVILAQKDYLSDNFFSFVLAQDKKKILLFREDKYNSMEFILFDISNHIKLWHSTITFIDFRLSYDIRNIVLTNNGNIFLGFEKFNYAFKRKKHKQYIFSIDPKNNHLNKMIIDFDAKLSIDFDIVVDEKNGELIASGLYSRKSNSKAEGYFLYKMDTTRLSSPIVFYPFTPELLRRYGNNIKKLKKYISDLKLSDLVVRNDGGLVMITEIQREVTRESLRRRYVDYHFEDMIFLGIHPDGELFWEEIIRKYQLSFDDHGMYSSYFLFKTPSKLRVIFNDEIKDENTISEYVFNPLGKGKRNSLFATDLHRLKLLFEEAKQISSDAFVVPSLHSGKYRLIMLSY